MSTVHFLWLRRGGLRCWLSQRLRVRSHHTACHHSLQQECRVLWQCFLCQGSGLCRYHFFFSPRKSKREGGKTEPTWFSMGVNLEYKVGDQIKIKDTFII